MTDLRELGITCHELSTDPRGFRKWELRDKGGNYCGTTISKELVAALHNGKTHNTDYER